MDTTDCQTENRMGLEIAYSIRQSIKDIRRNDMNDVWFRVCFGNEMNNNTNIYINIPNIPIRNDQKAHKVNKR